MKKLLGIVLALASLPLVAHAQTPSAAQAAPDFSGTWNIDLAKSDFGPAPQPTVETEVIKETGNNVTIASHSVNDMGTRDYTFAVVLGGPEAPFPAPATDESPFKILSSKAEWKGGEMVITQKTTFQDDPGTLTATYTLMGGGKVLMKAVHLSTSNGDFDLTEVYNKA